MSLALRQDPIGLYLHIPFCERRCHFCAFFTQGYREERADGFVNDLLAEIRIHAEAGSLRERTVETVYFGGGTPTSLSATQLIEILNACRSHFAVARSAEISVEANPAGVDERMLMALHHAGFNRLSFGAQSFDDRELGAIGSPHRAGDIIRAVEIARKVGWRNISLDLIYGLPGQSHERLRANFDAAIGLAPEHISFYGFTLEEGTRFARDAEQGRLDQPSDGLLADMYQIGRESLHSAGYFQYEVSNFSRPGYACLHNLGYWTDREWLGFGPAAHWYLNGERASNVESLEEYHRLLAGRALPIADREAADPDLRLREAMAFGLRKVAGVQLRPLKQRYGVSPRERFREPIERLVTGGWIEIKGGRVRPTFAGLALADNLAMAFL
jgi:oxygen-independent coproporphyrinogen-3 oxidase